VNKGKETQEEIDLQPPGEVMMGLLNLVHHVSSADYINQTSLPKIKVKGTSNKSKSAPSPSSTASSSSPRPPNHLLSLTSPNLNKPSSPFATLSLPPSQQNIKEEDDGEEEFQPTKRKKN